MAALPLIFYDAMMRPDVALRKQTGMCHGRFTKKE